MDGCAIGLVKSRGPQMDSSKFVDDRVTKFPFSLLSIGIGIDF